MPFCPKCRAEYLEGVMRCEDCGVSLEKNLPEEVEDPDAKLVTVFRAPNEIEAQMIRTLLEGNRIKCCLSGESLRHTHGIMVDGLAEVRILVRDDDEKRAMEIIEGYRRQS